MASSKAPPEPAGQTSHHASGESPTWRRSPWKRIQVAVIAALVSPMVALLGRTWRWRVSGGEHLETVVNGGRQPIMAFWHGRILSATYYFRHRGIVVITSENFDGEWIARIITRFGYGTARGSSSRGARRALIQLRRAMRAGKPVGFTLDGPRGPAFRAQPGAVWLAKATGNPVVPFHLEASRYWSLRSWDRTQIPWPFARVGLAVGEPLEVPCDADASALEAHRTALEAVLAQLRVRAGQLAASTG